MVDRIKVFAHKVVNGFIERHTQHHHPSSWLVDVHIDGFIYSCISATINMSSYDHILISSYGDHGGILMASPPNIRRRSGGTTVLLPYYMQLLKVDLYDFTDSSNLITSPTARNI